MKIKLKENYLQYIFLFIISFIVALFFSHTTSPLVESLGKDSGIFLLMGRGILDGYVPYRDLLDHKGPILYFIEAFGQLIPNTIILVWIFELLYIFFSLILLYKIAQKFSLKNYSILVPLSYIIFISRTMEGGNLTETHSLLWIILSIYIFVLSIKSNKVHPMCGFLLGFSFTLVFFIRPNNAIPIFCIIALLTLFLILNKNWKFLFKNILSCILGFLVVFLPIAGYYLYHNAIEDLLFGLFTFNFTYIDTNINSNFFALGRYQKHLILFTLLPVIGGVLQFFSKEKLFNNYFLGGSISVISIVTAFGISISQRTFSHYLLILAPFASIGIVLILCFLARIYDSIFDKEITGLKSIIKSVQGSPETQKNALEKLSSIKQLQKAKIWNVFGVILLFLFCAEISMRLYSGGMEMVRHEKSERDLMIETASLEIQKDIPVEEQNSIMTFDIAAFHLYTNTYPDFRIFYKLGSTTANHPKLLNETLDKITNYPSKWIVAPVGEVSLPEKINEVFRQKYKLYSENNFFSLYKLTL